MLDIAIPRRLRVLLAWKMAMLATFLPAACSSDGGESVAGGVDAGGSDSSAESGHPPDAGGTGGTAGTGGTGGTGGSTADAGDGPIRDVRLGRHNTCALMRDGSIYCWGQGSYRALGGDYNFQGRPRLIDAFNDATGLDCGRRFGCALRPGGALWCWGENHLGQVGSNETVPCCDCVFPPNEPDSICVPTPQPMGGLEKDVADVALGDAHGCALHTDASLSCWGSNAYGQLAQPSLEQLIVDPEPVPGITGVTRVAVGQSHSCALVGFPGEVHCWGRNGNAQVGNGSTDEAVLVPSRVAGIDDAIGIAAGGSHTCALRQSGSVVCWGYNYFGQLGNDSTKPTRATSIQNVASLDDAVQVTAGQHFTCALRASGAVVCWGHNGHGQLGDGTTEDRTSPVSVTVVEQVAMVSAGDLHACAASHDGRLWCWGYNLGGQLGTGSVDHDPVPTPVLVEQLPP